MEWIKYTINTTDEAEDLVCSMLNELGITGNDKIRHRGGTGGGKWNRQLTMEVCWCKMTKNQTTGGNPP